MKTVARTSLFVSLLGLSLPGCTDEPKKMEDVISSSQESGGKGDHEFKVDQETGKVTFKAEIVYFGFDEATLTEQGIERLSALAGYMKENPHVNIKVSGHCDERGSTEYNLALGHRRSESVRKFLLDAGVDKKRVAAVSFGEENPAAQGSGEEIWSQNRRAEFAFLGLKPNEKQSAKGEMRETNKNSKSPEIAPVQVAPQNGGSIEKVGDEEQR